MTSTLSESAALSTPTEALPPSPPLSRAARWAAGACLIVAGITNGLSQYLGSIAMPDLEDFSAQIRWGASHEGIQFAEQTTMLVSMLFLPFGLLGLAHVARWGAPKLTAVGLVLTLFGMWGFHNVVALGYAAGTVGPDAIGTGASVALNEGFLDHPGVIVAALVPHLLGSFIGLILLGIACWRSGRFPRTPLVLLFAFLVWDFMLPSAPPLEPHVLLFVSFAWLGVHLIRMPARVWAGSRP